MVERVNKGSKEVSLESDWTFPGVLLKAVKPERFVEKFNELNLYSIVSERRASINQISSQEFKNKRKIIYFRKLLKDTRKESSRKIRSWIKGISVSNQS